MKAEVLHGEESCTVGAQSGGRLAWLQASSVALLMELGGGCCDDPDTDPDVDPDTDPDVDPDPDADDTGGPNDPNPDPDTDDPGGPNDPDPLPSEILSGESDWRLGSSWATEMIEGASTLTKTSLQLLWSVCSLLKCLLM